MHANFNALPSLVALAILVAVFAAIARHYAKERVELWLAGWFLVLVRSGAQFLHPRNAVSVRLDLAIGLVALEVASIAFVVSVAPMADTRRRQLLLASTLALPALAYTDCMIWQVRFPGFYYALVAIGFGGVLYLLWQWYRAVTPYVASVAAGGLVLSSLVIWSIAAGHSDYGVHLFLAAMNFFAAGLYWYKLQRASAGVIATVVGFVTWGATFPVALVQRTIAPGLPVESEVWNLPKYLVAVGMIVTLLEDQIRQSEHLAYHDALTGLPNRRLLQDRLLQAIAHADRAGHKLAVLLLDLDDFKEVNDNFGHRIGDAALQQVVLRLSARMRASDTLARTGGDEFTVVSEVSSAQGAQTLVSALESALVLPIKVEGRLVQTGVSIGYAMYPEDATDPTELCAAADKAMYAAKRGSRPLRSTGNPLL